MSNNINDYGQPLSPFRYWCQSVIPLVYDETLTQYELLCKVVNYINELVDDDNKLVQDITQLNNYVNHYFDNLDVQEEINHKLDVMTFDGSLTNLIKRYVDPIYTAYETSINNTVGTQNSKIAVLENRMDTFSSLPNGSTTGDAELTDIRVPADGFNDDQPYPTAGDATRGQVTTLNNKLFALNKYRLNGFNYPYNDVYGKTITYKYDELIELMDQYAINAQTLEPFVSQPTWSHFTIPAKGVESVEITESVVGLSGTLGYILIVDNGNVIRNVGLKQKYTLPNNLSENAYIIINRFLQGNYATQCDIKFKAKETSESGINWSGYKWVCIGDSLTTSTQYTNKFYYDYINDKTGIQAVDMGVSGTGYLNKSANQSNFYERASLVDSDANVITFFGSLNDINGAYYSLGNATDVNTTTLCGAINTAITNVLAKNPTARIGIITPTPWKDFLPNDPTSLASRYVEKMIEICKLRGIPCLDLYHNSGMQPQIQAYRNRYYANDPFNGVHPSAEGHKIIAALIMDFLNKLLY